MQKWKFKFVSEMLPTFVFGLKYKKCAGVVFECFQIIPFPAI